MNKKYQLAYLRVDHSMAVRYASANLQKYGYGNIPIGAHVDDHLDFMVGLDSQAELDLPVVASPAGIPISVSLLPDSEQLTVIISNASDLAAQRQQLQQAANENELLVQQQKKLMAAIEHASSELELKNTLLREASRLQTSFLSGVSHEFRTPLTSIIGYTNLLSKDICDGAPETSNVDKSLGYIRAVQRSSKHLLSLVENLLDHGKLDAEEIVIRPRATKLYEVFTDVELLFKPLCETKNIGLCVSFNAPPETEVFIDDSRIRQCLINLVGNAIKFTDEGSVNVSARYDSEVLTVEVRDSGLGIGAADLANVRLPFWQAPDTGKTGTGLGLTITDRILELMGGELKIRSELGAGTRVNFTLPAAQMPTDSQPLEPFDSQGLNVLMAEDDSDIADLLKLMLCERGVKVTHVENGALALDALQAQQFDLILMDIHMPLVSGYEAIAELRARGNQTPVVVMSASALDHDRARATELACDGYLIKPVEIEDVLAIAAQII